MRSILRRKDRMSIPQPLYGNVLGLSSSVKTPMSTAALSFPCCSSDRTDFACSTIERT